MSWKDEAWSRWTVAAAAAAAAVMILTLAAWLLVERALQVEYSVRWLGAVIPLAAAGAWFLAAGWGADRDAHGRTPRGWRRQRK